jgi:hypothetical protein
MTIDEVGHALYGDRWQSALAHALGKSPRAVRQWHYRERSVPPVIWEQLHAMLIAKRNRIEDLLNASRTEQDA